MTNKLLRALKRFSSNPNDFLHAKLLMRLLLRSRLQSSMRRDVAFPDPMRIVQFDKLPVWRFWHSGWSAEKLPDVVRVCDESVETYLGAEFEIIRLSDDNFLDYVKLPDSVLAAYKKGRLSKNHFSDILRLWLVAAYGGLWLDATVYISRQPTFLNEDTFVYSQFPIDHARYGLSRYVGWLLWSQAPSPWFGSAYRCFLNSWVNSGGRVRDYTLIDLCLEESAALSVEAGRHLRFESQANASIVQAAMRRDVGIGNFYTALDQFDVHKLSLEKSSITRGSGPDNDFRRERINDLHVRLTKYPH